MRRSSGGCAHLFETIDEFVRWCLAWSSKKVESPQAADANVAPSQGEAGDVKPEADAPAEYGAGASAELKAADLAEPIATVSVESGAAIPAELNVAPVEPNAADQTEPAPSLSVLIKSWRAQSEEYDRALQGF